MIPAFAAQISGHLDTVTADSITGWAWNAEVPEESVSVEIAISSDEGPGASTFIATQALLPREDLKIALGSENHSFSCQIDWSKLSGETFTVTAAAISGEEKFPLIGTYTVHKSDFITETPAAVSEASADLIPEAVQNAAAQETKAVEPGAYLGEFKATGYCNCQKCSGGYTKTYSGTIPKANHTISADLNVFPIGTKLIIDGITYTVEDKGSSVNGNKVDIFFATHAEALAFGMKTVDVYAAK
ncbi:MAG: hypothetical protein E7246_09270 [Lachnoclostridium sp.]|nr:hypothetical protein [Lachnoclostridium sp.]